jgi:hypothetical protein
MGGGNFVESGARRCAHSTLFPVSGNKVERASRRGACSTFFPGPPPAANT